VGSLCRRCCLQSTGVEDEFRRRLIHHTADLTVVDVFKVCAMRLLFDVEAVTARVKKTFEKFEKNEVVQKSSA